MTEISKTRTMEYIGTDDWSRPVYKCIENGYLWKDIDLGDSEAPSLCSCGNDFDGEPDSPIKPEFELRFVRKPPSKENRFNYMMLSRMQSDCEYYLGFGNRSKKRLAGGEDEQEHINEMKRLWNIFPDDKKPEWLTMEQIEKYELQMVEQDVREGMVYSGKVVYTSGFGVSFETSLYTEENKLYMQSEESGKMIPVQWNKEGESVKPI